MNLLEIYVDADACPVKEEVNRVAKRYQLSVTYVANCQMRLPDSETSKLVVEGLHDGRSSAGVPVYQERREDAGFYRDYFFGG